MTTLTKIPYHDHIRDFTTELPTFNLDQITHHMRSTQRILDDQFNYDAAATPVVMTYENNSSPVDHQPRLPPFEGPPTSTSRQPMIPQMQISQTTI